MCHGGVGLPQCVQPMLHKAVGVWGGKTTQEVLTPRRKSPAALWSFRGCQQLRLCLASSGHCYSSGEGRWGRGKGDNFLIASLK